jgi:hypothetical protein
MPVGEIPFTTEALKANLSWLENEWENYQTTRDRGGIYGYLTAVFELVTWWKHEHKNPVAVHPDPGTPPRSVKPALDTRRKQS